MRFHAPPAFAEEPEFWGPLQASDFLANVSGRYLRVTVTNASPLVVNGNGTWASFFDLSLAGI